MLKSTQDDLAPVPGGIHRLAIRLVARKDADPWLASILMGEVELVLGIRARNPDRFAAILHERPQDPRVHWQAAEKLFIKAWLLHRNYPEPAALMMPLIDLAAGPDKMVQFWFQRATAAQFDWIPAYDEMAAHLRKQGDENALYAFAVECLKSGRYDTEIPWRFLVYIDDIASRTQSCASWRKPDVYANICEFFRGNAQNPRNKDMHYYHSLEAMFSYFADHLQDARKALDRAGDQVDRTVFKGHTRTPEIAVARTYAMTGRLAARALAMEKAADAGETENAARTCRQILATLGQTDKSRPYFRDHLVTAEIEAKFAAGDWVPIQPDADLAGWTVTFGQWSVDDRGRLVGTWNPKDSCAAMLLCHAKINPNFELMGHAEVVESDGGAGFGAILSYRHVKSYWECIFYPAVTEDTGEAAYIPSGNHAYVRAQHTTTPMTALPK